MPVNCRRVWSAGVTTCHSARGSSARQTGNDWRSNGKALRAIAAPSSADVRAAFAVLRDLRLELQVRRACSLQPSQAPRAFSLSTQRWRHSLEEIPTSIATLVPT